MSMKGIKKYLFLLAALAAVFGFVACSDDDDDDGPATVAVYKAEVTGSTQTATFFDDGTFLVEAIIPQVGTTEIAVGTYKDGDPAADGEITLTYTKLPSGAPSSYLNTDTKVTVKDKKVEIFGTTYTRQ